MTEGKLRNFSEIQAFITITCPFSSNIDSQDYKGMYLVNHIEIYLAFNLDNWGKLDLFDYSQEISDYSKLLPEQKIEENEDDQINLEKMQPSQQIELLDLVLRSFFKSYDHFKNKLYHGLVYRKKNEIQKYELGDKGFAQGYKKITEQFKN